MFMQRREPFVAYIVQKNATPGDLFFQSFTRENGSIRKRMNTVLGLTRKFYLTHSYIFLVYGHWVQILHNHCIWSNRQRILIMKTCSSNYDMILPKVPRTL